jgi:hypothetical protein
MGQMEGTFAETPDDESFEQKMIKIYLNVPMMGTKRGECIRFLFNL